MSKTTHLKLPNIEAAQAQKHVTHNEALRIIDAVVQISVLDKDLASAPPSPTVGDRYIVAASATGTWSGQDNAIAIWQDSAWAFHTPTQGWLAWVADENKFYLWNGTLWTFMPISASQIQSLDQLGVNATADATNRLSVKSPAILFDNQSTDIQVKLNKNIASNTASLLMQTGFSGRAEIGLTGNDNLTFKVSSDGSTWNDSFSIAAGTGEAEFDQPLALKQYSKSSLPSATTSGRLIYVHDATGGSSVAYSDGSSWRRISDSTVIN